MIIILNLISFNGFGIDVIVVFFFFFSLLIVKVGWEVSLNSLEELIMANFRIVTLVVYNRICCYKQ